MTSLTDINGIIKHVIQFYQTNMAKGELIQVLIKYSLGAAYVVDPLAQLY